MRTFLSGIAAAVLLAQSALAGTGNTVATDNVKARLVSEASAIAPGETITLALELDIRDGWHTYWRNPGDSGQATRLKWTLPPAFKASDIEWTTPHRFDIPPLVNLGYAKHAMHLVQITAPPDLRPGGTVDLAAKANWLVCADLCIPESGDLRLTLPVGTTAGAKDPAVAPLFAAARADLPVAALGRSTAAIRGNELILTLGEDWGGTLKQIKTLTFYPFTEGVIKYAEPQKLVRDGDGVSLAMALDYAPPKSGPVAGLLLVTEDGGAQTQTIPMNLSADFAGGAAGAAAAAAPSAGRFASRSAPAEPVRSFFSLVLLAIAGGLILNLMPCVFPVLSIKAIGLVEQAKKSPGAVRLKGLAFAAGVLASMLALAAMLLALRAGGQQIGWGFQLQSPLFVTLMAYLFLAIGLNLSGVFELGGSLAGVGDRLTQGNGLRASFFTGALTTLVATPCSAPFMATAIGWALSQPAAVALTIFASLGFGLALPYLLLSFAPVLRRALPKPGAWMDTLKQFFAFPMYSSAAWLLWVLAQQTSPTGLAAALTGSVLIAFSAWAFQKSHASIGGRRLAMLATSTIAVVLALALPTRVDAVAQPGPRAGASDEWQPYDAARLQDIVASGKPVLVNFTAAWCLTCLVNERNAFADPHVQEIFKSKGVVLMKGDWTNREPAITSALAAFGRAGVPLYVVYNSNPANHDPVVLPQLLTPDIVRDSFSQVTGR